MSNLKGKIKKELNILFHALCDGLRQEVRQRSLAHLVTKEDFSLTSEREAGVASSLVSHLRLVGFAVQLEAYFPSGSQMRRPDFCIWLPASKQFIYLELKQIAWGDDGRQYDYARAINDIKKLKNDPTPNGLIALGFNKINEQQNQLIDGVEKSLAQRIASGYSLYEKIGLEHINLEGMSERCTYAVIGLWIRTS